MWLEQHIYIYIYIGLYIYYNTIYIIYLSKCTVSPFERLNEKLTADQSTIHHWPAIDKNDVTRTYPGPRDPCTTRVSAVDARALSGRPR